VLASPSTVSGEASSSEGNREQENKHVFLRKNFRMSTHYLVRKEDNERICANIVAKLDELYETNRTLIDQDSQPAWEAVQENWKYMRELEARLIERKNPKIYKEC
tara:strand:- start:12 stop:326 length:315 start_codon:yes stop_codon:yes gene_type:complete